MMRRCGWLFVVLLLAGCGSGTNTAGTATRSVEQTQVAGVLAATPASSPAHSSTGLITWNDADHRIQLQYPADWTVSRVPDDDTNVVQFIAADYILGIDEMNIGNIFDASTLFKIHDTEDHDPKRIYTNGPPTDTRIAGGDAVTFSGTYITRANSSATRPNLSITWVVRHGLETWILQADGKGMWSRADVDKVVSSMRWL